MISFQRR